MAIIIVGCTTTFAFLGFCGGGGSKFIRGEEIDYQVPEFETYKNHIEIEGQWGASKNTGENGQYGIGDPFVMRYNGKYYMYPSTSDPCDGIKVFESTDLVNWTYKGFAVAESEQTVHGAYAPEVIYYNGYFYMCQSRAGKGHYIYRSESPTHGFTLISKTEGSDSSDINYGNLGLGIDGAFYVDNNGKLYLMHTVASGGLRYNEITDVNDIRVETIGASRVLGTANLSDWIEGPGIFNRGAYSYLTYTGNHVTSNGYRVAYSYAKDLNDLSKFIQPVENVTLIDTHSEHRGLGHSSNVNGPNLDSVYTAYHDYVGGGPQRRYNVDRYFAFGGLVTANGVTKRSVAVPEKCDFEAFDASNFEQVNGIYALGKSDKYFTAEYNFIPTNGQKIVFGATQSGAYEITVENGKISLFKVENGKRSLLGEKQVYIANQKLCTVRVENGNGEGYVYYNGMKVISYGANASEGYIGYAIKDGVNYTAFTNDVFGTSDFESIKNFPLTFPAVTYLKGENRGFSIANAKEVSGGVRVGEKQDITQIGDNYAVNLGKEDWVKYAVDIGNDDDYILGAKISLSTNATLKITIGNSVLQCEVNGKNNASNGDGKTVNVSLGKINLKAGVQTMKVEVLSGSTSIISLTAEENANTLTEIKLSDFVKQSGSVTVGEDSVTVNGGKIPGCVLWGNNGLGDFEVTFNFIMQSDMSANLGIMLRVQNYSYHASQVVQSWQGYYLMLQPQMFSVRRYDYNDSFLLAERVPTLNDGNVHTIVISAKNNVITCCIDNGNKLEICDAYAFLSGQIGLYAKSGTLTVTGASFKNL